MEVWITNLQSKIAVETEFLRDVVTKALRLQGYDDLPDVSVALVDDAYIQVLNREYRGADQPTDVLAFPMDPADATGGEPTLGDIVISVERARDQAAVQAPAAARDRPAGRARAAPPPRLRGRDRDGRVGDAVPAEGTARSDPGDRSQGRTVTSRRRPAERPGERAWRGGRYGAPGHRCPARCRGVMQRWSEHRVRDPFRRQLPAPSAGSGTRPAPSATSGLTC